MSIIHPLDDGLLTKRRYFPRGKYRLTFDCKDHVESQAALYFEESETQSIHPEHDAPKRMMHRDQPKGNRKSPSASRVDGG